MQKSTFYFIRGLVLAAATVPAVVQAASVATVPEGMITYTLSGNATNYLSLPLTNNVTYTSAVTAVTSTTITVGDTPAPFTTSLSGATSPYFVKFLSGAETGRILLITANTSSELTLNTKDDSAQTVGLTTSGFSVQAGDTFEIFPADTLASVFGANTEQNPLLIQGSTVASTADSVILYKPTYAHSRTYYFNTTKGYWETNGLSGDASNTILYPYGAIAVKRGANETAISLVLSGRVTEVPIVTKTMGGNVKNYCSTGYANDLTLAQLNFGSNWVTSTSSAKADAVGVWNAALGTFDTYFQEPDSTWRKSDDTVTDQSQLVISAGTAISILQRKAVSGATSFLSIPLPYSLD